MTVTDPSSTTVRDLCFEALRMCGAFGIGTTPLAEDTNGALVRLGWLLQAWQQKRWMVWHLVDLSFVCNGGPSYSIGPGGNLATVGPRPDRIDSAFIRQLLTSPGQQIDWPLQLMDAREDWNRLRLKGMHSIPQLLFYDAIWPQGQIYLWPLPNSQYELHVSVRQQLATNPTALAQVLNLPYEYFQAIVLNLALALRPVYGIVSVPGDSLPMQARAALDLIKDANSQIGTLQMPDGLPSSGGNYNIFSDGR